MLGANALPLTTPWGFSDDEYCEGGAKALLPVKAPGFGEAKCCVGWVMVPVEDAALRASSLLRKSSWSSLMEAVICCCRCSCLFNWPSLTITALSLANSSFSFSSTSFSLRASSPHHWLNLRFAAVISMLYLESSRCQASDFSGKNHGYRAIGVPLFDVCVGTLVCYSISRVSVTC